MSDATQLTYLDFDLAIEAVASASTGSASAQTYRARVLNSPAGQAMVEFILPFNPYELENYILKIGRTRRTVRSLNSQEGQAARDFGERLYNAVFKDEVRDALRRSLDKADGQVDHGLRIRLRLGDAPALLDLPWEYLYDPTLRRFFCHSTTTPLVRYPQQPRPVTPLGVTLPLQVLVLIANPSDVAALDVEGEWHKIEAAVAGLRDRGLVQLTRLENGTLAALQRQLRQGRYHIFHFVGHGGLNGLTGERVLYLEDERGRAHAVGGDHLGTLLRDHRSLRLALLNACEGARATTNDPFAGIAQQLVHQGIPAIIAMQFEITDGAALILAQEFYGALADGYPVEAALAEARKAIFVAGNDVEWGTPVLYSRANDGLLFRVEETRAKGAPEETRDRETRDRETRDRETRDRGHLPGRGDKQSGKPEDSPAPSRKIDEPPAVPVQSNIGPLSSAGPATTTRWRRPGMFAMLFIGVALLGLLISSPRLASMLNQGANGRTPAAATAVLATSAQEVAVEPLSSVTPTPSITPDAEATAAAMAKVTTVAATETAVATLAAVPTATLTATLHLAAPPSPMPQPTHTVTVRVIIERIEALDEFDSGTFDSGIVENPPDFFALVTIDGQKFERSPIIEDQAIITPNWEFSTPIALLNQANQTVIIKVEIWDTDEEPFSTDDLADLDTDGDNPLNLTVNLLDCIDYKAGAIAGNFDTTKNCHESITVQGDAGEHARITFRVIAETLKNT